MAILRRYLEFAEGAVLDGVRVGCVMEDTQFNLHIFGEARDLLGEAQLIRIVNADEYINITLGKDYMLACWVWDNVRR